MVALVQSPTQSPTGSGNRLAANLDPYGQLIRMLLPRAQDIAVYATGGLPLWQANGVDEPHVQQLAAELMAPSAGAALEIDCSTRAFDGANAYAFRLRDEHGHPLAVVACTLQESGEARPCATVLKLLRPALECLQRELAMRASLGAMSRDLSSRDRDLDLLLDTSAEQADAPHDGDDLGRLVQSAVDHLQCAIGALIIPEKSVAIVRAHRDSPPGSAPDVVTRTHRHLMTFAQLQRRTMVVNRVGAAADKVPPYKILSVPVRHVSSRVIGFLAMFNPATAPNFELRQTRLAELLARKVTSILLTNFDNSTGLLTRTAFEQSVEAAIAAHGDDAHHSVVYLDIDQLHVTNENFGMHVGDEVIMKVAEVVRRRTPVGSLCARISGDRFAAFLVAKDADAAARVAEEIRSGVAELSQVRPDGPLKVSASAGVAQLPAGSKQPLAHALALAEIACKAAKDRGRDRVEMFVDSDVSIVRRHTDVHVVAQLRDALENDRFRLYAQPILPLSSGPSLPRFEILLRLETEHGELLPPGKFLGAAERYQLITAIDRWVVKHSLKALAAHGSALSSRAARFAINLSGQSVVDAEAAAYIEGEFRETQVAPDLVCFELTETAAVSQLERADAFMQRLRALGCQFALDDFGTGASSLAYLKNLPVSVLKIDGSFVRDAETNPRSESMVKAVAQLASAMGITTVAEYVETDELRVRMSNLGVDYGQGFAIGKPMPLADVLQDLALYEMLASDGVHVELSGESLLQPDSPLLAG
jgi:diguanylate cyclase (GGDEF)-like protein